MWSRLADWDFERIVDQSVFDQINMTSAFPSSSNFEHLVRLRNRGKNEANLCHWRLESKKLIWKTICRHLCCTLRFQERLKPAAAASTQPAQECTTSSQSHVKLRYVRWSSWERKTATKVCAFRRLVGAEVGKKTQPVVFGRGDLMQSLDSKRPGLGGGVGRRDPYRR